MDKAHRRRTFLRRHSLGMASIVILGVWVVSYIRSDPSTHLGSFFGNAIADWTGVVVTVLATKYMYEIGSSESRKPPRGNWLSLEPLKDRLRDHSLSIFLLVTGALWIALFLHMNSESKWGQVVGNIVSEWTQIFGLVLLTKRLIETHSKESDSKTK
jgi:hypothetical protein